MNTVCIRFLTAAVLAAAGALAEASTITLQDNFTGTATSMDWTALEGACLTAGDNTATIPACKGLAYYGSQTQTGLTNNTDPAGQGALRLTNGCANGTCNYHQAGAIISNTTYPTDQGVQVTFTTYTYGGDNSGGHGADGIGFYLLDGSQSANIGSWGGSLGYSCSNTNSPYTGMVGAYLGLGMDEYGNFLNQSDNTAAGYGYQPGRIGLRGYGNIAWSWLNAQYPSDYPSSLSSSKQQSAVKNTCSTGYLWNYSNSSSPVKTTTQLADYAPIPNAYLVLPASTPLAAESAHSRTNAVPISYKLKITQNSLLSLWYSYNGGTYVPVLTDQSISSANGPLPSTFKFGFGGSTGGSDNVHEITCFQVTPANLSVSSASLNLQQSGEVKTDTQVYLAFYHTDNWWGELTSQNLVVDPTTGAASIDSVANWDASCVLTGGDCQMTGATGMTAQSGRNLFTWNGTSGTALTWSNLTGTEQGWLNDDGQGQSRLAYLTGDRSNEIDSSGTGLFRARNGVLGDIIDSSPVWVGPPLAPYADTWVDDLDASASPPENAATAQTYSQFVSSAGTRTNVVYDGANDGFLHGFEAGAYDSNGDYVSTDNDGKELLGYMPQAVLQTIHTTGNNGVADFSSAHYAHNYYADATPGTGDLFYNGAWHTWLISGLGAGGNAIFALDITDPAQFSTGNPVIGEWNGSTLSCANVTSCGQYLGETYGTPQIRRLHNGEWAILFGNGLDGSGGHAGIYVMTVDASGTPSSTYFLDTGVGTASSPDGIAAVTPVDLDGDHITDYVYAGDTDGNLWRFDVTSDNPANWKVSSFGGSGPNPLFTTSSGQPITTQVAVVRTVTASGNNQVMVDFGTGQSQPQTASSPIQYATGQQTLYGIIDWDMGAWNALGSKQYVSWTGGANAPSPSSPITLSELQQQTITGTFSVSVGNTTGYRTVSDTGVSSTQLGWYLNLPGYIGVTGVGGGKQTEQVVYNPIESDGAFIVNTVVPPNNSPTTCSVNTAQGWSMALNPATGGALPTSFFGYLSVGSVVSGVADDATGTPAIIHARVNGNENHYLVSQTTNGQGNVVQITPQYGGNGGQLTWIQIR